MWRLVCHSAEVCPELGTREAMPVACFFSPDNASGSHLDEVSSGPVLELAI